MWGNGSTISLSGQGLINNTGDPTRFTYYGTKNNTTVNLSGSSDFIGVIYAPYAELKVSGGSNKDPRSGRSKEDNGQRRVHAAL
jgi:hypothetical protein